MINRWLLLVVLFPLLLVSQNIKGKVIDKVTREPVETASIYFDHTTIGTTTDENGEFSIEFNDAVQSNLVISFLGYEKVLITDYRSMSNVIVELVVATNTLDEVYVNFDDELTRAQKLQLFRKEFLGTSRVANSCKILNEEDLVLYYDSDNQTLYASSPVPVVVKNRLLQYEIDFEEQRFLINAVKYLGTSFYKDLNVDSKKRVQRNRKKVYNGSVQHFIRALFNQSLKAENYQVYSKGKKVNEWNYISVAESKQKGIKELTLKSKISILYKRSRQSTMELKTDKIYIDVYGNYAPIISVYLTGYLGDQRVGDTLPSDFGLKK